MEIKTWSGINPTQTQSEGHLTESLDSLLPNSLGFSHATWHFSESTHRSSPPTVVKSDNPIITTILNGLFRSEVSQSYSVYSVSLCLNEVMQIYADEV